jgi:hypothetical protein
VFCGAWTNYGFHEDGLTSGLLAAGSIGAELPFKLMLNGGYPTHRSVFDPPPSMGIEKLKVCEPMYPVKVRKESSNFYWFFGGIALVAILVVARQVIYE